MRKGLCFVFLLASVMSFCFANALSAAESGPEKIMIYQGTDWQAQLYGFVKLDAVFNDSAVLNPECPFWAFSDDTPNHQTPSEEDGSLTFSARTSRLGFHIWGPTALGAKTHARFEFDFWGGQPDAGTSARQSEMRLRLAYIELLWPTKTYILAGNNWMLGTPLYALPDMLTFIPLAGAGLLFMREPQVAIGQTIGNNTFSVTIEASISRAQGNDGSGSSADFYNPGPRSTSSDNQLDKTGVGEASKQPSYKGRITFRLNPAQGFSFILGGSGQYMREVHAVQVSDLYSADTDTANDLLDYRQDVVKSWYGQGFAAFTLGPIRLTGHYFQGENIDTYFGGIGQGVTVRNKKTADAYIDLVKSKGGFGELHIDLRSFSVPLTFSFGNGTEVVEEDTIATGNRKKNSVSWGNFWWYMNPNFRFGVEVAYIETEYLGIEDGDDWKVQSSFMFTF
ncbi:MAG TPA: hypothetical protein PK253_10050 [Spirochaetota bacterium]|nr:hypothetical protein [Spirochaetota bacterium]